jgi:hypothetical protein
MATTPSVLGNTFSQTCLAIQCTYDWLVNSYVGPNNTCSAAFCIQGPNKQPAIYITNIATTYKNSNTLCFDTVNNDTTLCLYSCKSFYITDNTSTYLRIGANNCFVFGTGSNADTFTINQNKNIGIGTSSPSYKLDIQCSGVSSPAVFSLNNIATNNTSYPTCIRLNANTSCLELSVYPNGYYCLTPNSNATTGYIDANSHIFRTVNSTEKLRFDGLGNVLINTTCAAGKFNVAGDSVALSTGACLNQNLINIQSTASASSYSYFNFKNDSFITNSQLKVENKTDGSSYISFYTTPAGAKTSDRKVLALDIGCDQKISAYSNFCAYTGCFNYVTGCCGYFNTSLTITGSNFCNLTQKTIFGKDNGGCHWFSNGINNVYSFISDSNSVVTGHKFQITGIDALVLDSKANLCVSGLVCSISGLQITGSNQNYIYGKSLCVFLTDPNNNYCISGNQFLIGSLCATGAGSFNSICLTGINPNLTSCICHCLCVNNNSYLKDVCTNTVTGSCACFNTCVSTPLVSFGSICQCGSTTSNFLLTDLIIGTSCDKQVKSINTAKSWGLINFVGGSATLVAGYNLCSVFKTCTYASIAPTGIVGYGSTSTSAYSIRFCNPIKGSFSASFSVFYPFSGCNYIGLSSSTSIFNQYRLSDVILQNCISIATTAINNSSASYIPLISNPATSPTLTAQPIYEIVVSPILSDSCSYASYTIPSYICGMVSFQIFSC